MMIITASLIIVCTRIAKTIVALQPLIPVKTMVTVKILVTAKAMAPLLLEETSSQPFQHTTIKTLGARCG
jgi:hypothetical protein